MDVAEGTDCGQSFRVASVSVEDDYQDYEDAKADEGGLHPGRSDPASGLGWMVILGIGGLVLTVVMVGMMLR